MTGFLPATLAYVYFRWVAFPADRFVFWPESTGKFLHQFFVAGSRANDWIATLLTFGVLSLFAAYGWWLIREHRDHPLVRWSPLVPLIVIVPFVLALNVGRVWAYAFPVVIPLSLVGIRSFVRLRP